MNITLNGCHHNLWKPADTVSMFFFFRDGSPRLAVPHKEDMMT